MLVPFEPTPGLTRNVEAARNEKVRSWWRVEGRGYTGALRLVARFEDGKTAFVKCATAPNTANWIGREQRVYEALGPQLFLPALLGTGDDGTPDAYPFLLLEDLTDCVWPPPWNDRRLEAVWSALQQVSAWRGPLLGELGSAQADFDNGPGWARVQNDPVPFLSLGLCSAAWLNTHLPALMYAADNAPLAGDALLHLDVRSDNLCFRPDGSAVLVDWNWASRGNAQTDIACFLPSLTVEGGPLPDSLLPDAGGFAARLAGWWAASAGLPTPPGASPHLRPLQKAQLIVALAWAARSLKLGEVQ